MILDRRIIRESEIEPHLAAWAEEEIKENT